MVKACCCATCVECMSIVNERHESKACRMHVSNKVKEMYLGSSSDDKSSGRSFSDVRATAGQLSRDLAGDPKHIYKYKIQQESAPSRGS